jgi:hypothetical protein
MKTVRILGPSRNVAEMPPLPKGVEVWAHNDVSKYGTMRRRVVNEYTRWFNLHSRQWMTIRYPNALAWHKRQDGRTFYTQKRWPDLPGSTKFPRTTIQEAFATARGPNRYFTCTVAWCMALAILEEFQRIELWGFEFGDKPGARYAYQRPCFFYWVDRARERGIVVTYQKKVQSWPHIAGDPDAYTGPIYGYDTRPEDVSAAELRRLAATL